MRYGLSVAVLVRMAVVGIGVVRMHMRHGFMAMQMRMGPGRDRMAMRLVLMVLVVRMHVRMLQHLMAVCMGVVFCQVQPDTKGHQAGSCQQLPGHRFCQKQH